MSSFFIGAKNRVLKGKAAPKGKGGKGRVFPREKPYPERVKGHWLHQCSKGIDFEIFDEHPPLFLKQNTDKAL
ncbi:TPA: hypothetical protein KDY96_004012 [Vibrio parahaemolyticus]|nr:hypothetical protein [Vibrio parahaemolyticus]